MIGLSPVAFLRVPQYWRNLRRTRAILKVIARHGFSDVIVRAGLDAKLGFLWRRILLTEDQTEIMRATWEERVRMVFEDLGPTFVKLGQIMATRPDLIPMSLVLELRKLQDNVPPFAFEEVRRTIEEDTGTTLAELFASFDEAPLAAASIAQVHRATLKSGEHVVVKVQRPHLKETIETDLAILRIIALQLDARVPEVRQFNVLAAVDEFSRSLKREIDFRNELWNLERYRKNFAQDPTLHVPVTYPKLCSVRFITMEFIAGVKVTDLDALHRIGVDPGLIARNGTQIVLDSIFKYGFFHADPHPGNFFVLPGGTIALIDFGMMGSVDKQRMDELLTFLVSILLNDTEMMVNLFLELGLIDEDTDVRALRGEVSGVIERYYGQSLDQIDIGAFIAQVFEVVVRHHVWLPGDLLLVAKSITTMEGIAQEILPSFNPIEMMRPYLVTLYVKRTLDPLEHSKRIYRVVNDWLSLAQTVPRDVRSLLGKARKGELTLRVERPGEYEREAQKDRIANRAIVTALTLAWMGITAYGLANSSPAAGPPWWVWVAGTAGLTSGSVLLMSLLRSRGI